MLIKIDGEDSFTHIKYLIKNDFLLCDKDEDERGKFASSPPHNGQPGSCMSCLANRSVDVAHARGF